MSYIQTEICWDLCPSNDFCAWTVSSRSAGSISASKVCSFETILYRLLSCYTRLYTYINICVYICTVLMNANTYAVYIYANHQPHLKKKVSFCLVCVPLWWGIVFIHWVLFSFLMRPLAISRYCCFLVRNTSGRLTIWLCFANEPFWSILTYRV